MDRFKALLITRDEATKVQAVSETTLAPDDLMDGNVDVRVTHSTVNYKDGLAITGKLPVVRRFPMIPGVDLAGIVQASDDPAFKPGDRVVLNGWGVGETHYGAFSEMARVRGEWLIPQPAGLTPAEAMAIGTAGYAAMLAVMALEKHDILPQSGPVAVTGAAGGLGSIAVALLSRLGYPVIAITGRPGERAYLERLGASEISDRSELEAPAKLLARERWAGAVDAVGGNILANVIAMTQYGGAVAACGNAAGMALTTSVAPFILRGVALLGIESTHAPKPQRIEAWNRLARDLDRDKLASMTEIIPFSGIVEAAHGIVDGRIRGRLVAEIG